MKLFQQMLVAPAALGLLAPLAVVNSPGANAAELNINGVSDYAASADQVTSVTQFSDVYPTETINRNVTVGSYFSSWRNASLLVDVLFAGGISLAHQPSLTTNFEIIVITSY